MACRAARTVVLIGGIHRLERHYVEEAGRCGIDLKVFNESRADLSNRIGNAGALILFTNKISHHVRREIVSAAKSQRIPVFMCHSCGICSLRNCLDCLMNKHRDKEEKR